MKSTKILELIIFVGVVFLFVSCNKENKELNINSIEDKNDFSIVETIENNSYYNTDSLKIIKIDTGVLYNLGVGRDKVSKEAKLSIFNPNTPLQPIISISLNELFTKKIIASWDYLKSKRLAYSIIINDLKLDSILTKQYSDVTISSDSTIYIKLILLKQFGIAKIDVQNSKINDYLTYKTNIVKGVDKDNISVTPEIFRGIYGNEFRDSITIGVFVNASFAIRHVEFENNTRNAAIAEAIVMLRKVSVETSKWNDLKVHSEHFKRSDITNPEFTAIPRMNFSPSIEKLMSEINNVENLYKKADFGILSDCYQPFSLIYPDYKFSH